MPGASGSFLLTGNLCVFSYDIFVMKQQKHADPLKGQQKDDNLWPHDADLAVIRKSANRGKQMMVNLPARNRSAWKWLFGAQAKFHGVWAQNLYLPVSPYNTHSAYPSHLLLVTALHCSEIASFLQNMGAPRKQVVKIKISATPQSQTIL